MDLLSGSLAKARRPMGIRVGESEAWAGRIVMGILYFSSYVGGFALLSCCLLEGVIVYSMYMCVLIHDEIGEGVQN